MSLLAEQQNFGQGLRVLLDILYPYPLWYWALVIFGNVPVYIGLMYAVFFSRENFRAHGKFMLMSRSEQAEYGQYHVQIWAVARMFFWVGLCVVAVVLQHHYAWKGFFNYE
ncbi:MAG: hypothetical protein AAGB48_10310 [Planctomycetota bacterium]